MRAQVDECAQPALALHNEARKREIVGRQRKFTGTRLGQRRELSDIDFYPTQ
jgi:hypothetical protein